MALTRFWKHHFVGAVCYADGVALLAPSPALRNNYAKDMHQLC